MCKVVDMAGVFTKCQQNLGPRRWTRVGDGAYAGVPLAQVGAVRSVRWISRVRLDAQLYAFPRRTVAPRRGPQPLQGQRCTALANRLAEAYWRGTDLEVPG